MLGCPLVRTTVGQPEANLELDAGSGTSAVVDALSTNYPELARMLPRCALALNGEYVHDVRSLSEGDEVAVLPPMSGG